MTVKDAVLQSFKTIQSPRLEPGKFYILDLIKEVRNLTKRPFLTDGTITRALRLLRQDGDIDYKVTDNHKAIYQKITKSHQLKFF